MKLLVATTALLFLAHSSSAESISYPVTDNTCLTPNRQAGACVNIRKCSSIIAILKRPRPLAHEALEFVRTSHCGFEGTLPKVCCENQVGSTISPATTEATSSATPKPPDVTRHLNLRLLDHNICGPITEQKIFGGNKTGVFDFPWMALIAYQTSNGPEFRCGGSLINKRYVLTAAHCVTNLPNGLILTGVRLGDHDISKERDCDEDGAGLELVCTDRYQDFSISDFHYHPEYSRLTLQNDIALIRLSANADLRPASVRPICLPIGSASTISQKKVTVTGWGATEFGPRSQDLLKIFVSPVSNDQCAATYRKNTVITHKQMCAGGENNMDSCLGDSGGPLQSPAIYNDNVKYVQHGIVSFGSKNCGTKGFPGVYTRLVYFLDWILDTIEE